MDVASGVLESSNVGSQQQSREDQLISAFRRRHEQYRHQLDAALISTSKLQKCRKHFIWSLRVLLPDLSDLNSLTRLQELSTADELPPGLSEEDFIFARKNIDAFLQNIQNFRVLRQIVKMTVLPIMRRPSSESDSQRMIREDIEVLICSWGVLVAMDTDLQRLEHPGGDPELDILLKNNQEREHLTGVLSLIPKLMDIADNKLDFLLTKYYIKLQNTDASALA